MAIEIRPWDAAEYLDAPEDVAALVNVWLEDGTDAEIRHALRVVARSKGFASVARDADLTREALYKALGDDGNPTLDTLTKVAKALGMRVTLAVAA